MSLGVPPEERPEFTLDDFRSGRVFEWLTSLNGYQQAMQEAELEQVAKDLGFKAFKRCLKEYRKELREVRLSVIQEEGVSEFSEQEIELNTGEWTADESGIWRYGPGGGIVYACTHPIMPVQQLVSVDTGMVKVKLAYRRSFTSKKPWDYTTVPMSRISKASDIVALSDCNISVTSGERAQALVDFLRDAIDKNQGLIPTVKSVSRMGWNEEGFSPYVGGVEFDSADSFKPIFRAIGQEGSYSEWLNEARDIRSYSLTARIVLAASFASVLVEPLGCLPFFVHLWSMASGTGKTVAQMLGASVWANPTAGGAFFQTFKSTAVGVELMAGFLHSLPVFLDELQLAKDRHGNVVFNVYELAAGSGKLRGNKSLGLDYTPKWANCFITSGETPIVSESAGAGAVNRVVEIECRAGEKVIRDGRHTANLLKANYGHAGRDFVERLSSGGIEEANKLYDLYYTACIQSDTTEKQAMAAAIILTADHLVTDWIFKDNRALSAGELGEFLKAKESVSLAERGYEALCGWIASNAPRFRDSVENGEHYGVIEDNIAIINRTIFDRACADFGISPKALLSSLKVEGRILTGAGKGYTKTRRIDGIPTNCVWLRLPEDDPACNFESGFPL